MEYIQPEVYLSLSLLHPSNLTAHSGEVSTACRHFPPFGPSASRYWACTFTNAARKKGWRWNRHWRCLENKRPGSARAGAREYVAAYFMGL